MCSDEEGLACFTHAWVHCGLAQGMLGPSTDNGMSKMPPTVRRDERILTLGRCGYV